MNEMKREKHMTAFYLETVLMVIIFVLVIAVLAQVFSQARMQSREAARTTTAVCLAQNGAEAVAAAEDADALVDLLDENDNVRVEKAADGRGQIVTAYYNEEMEPAALEETDAGSGGGTSDLRMEISWKPDGSGTGTYVTSDIAVYERDTADPVYQLTTGVYQQRKEDR